MKELWKQISWSMTDQMLCINATINITTLQRVRGELLNAISLNGTNVINTFFTCQTDLNNHLHDFALLEVINALDAQGQNGKSQVDMPCLSEIHKDTWLMCEHVEGYRTACLIMKALHGQSQLNGPGHEEKELGQIWVTVTERTPRTPTPNQTHTHTHPISILDRKQII